MGVSWPEPQSPVRDSIPKMSFQEEQYFCIKFQDDLFIAPPPWRKHYKHYNIPCVWRWYWCRLDIATSTKWKAIFVLDWSNSAQHSMVGKYSTFYPKYKLLYLIFMLYTRTSFFFFFNWLLSKSYNSSCFKHKVYMNQNLKKKIFISPCPVSYSPPFSTHVKWMMH